MSGGEWATPSLWLAVLASGLYHGANPGMGWPLAVSAAMIERRPRALVSALGLIAGGHLLAMTAVLLPFVLLMPMLAWRETIQTTAALLVLGFGLYLLVWPRHPRLLARIPPARLALWSFAVAVAHGAGLMLLPVYLGLCRAGSSEASTPAASVVSADLDSALLVAIVHTVAMIAAGGAMAWLIYRYLGLKYVARTWLNLNAVWATSLILAGAASLCLIIMTP